MPSDMAKESSAFHIMSPRFNLREVAKQCVLLEDHLFHPAKRCPDCIKKHFLTIEAFLEEAVSLDKSGELTAALQQSAAYIRTLQTYWLDGRDMVEIAQFVRRFRKALALDSFDFRVAATCPHKVLAKLATKSKAQVEDEETRKLVKRLPKKKPPRNDLRKERVDLKEDEDIENLGQEGDRDLSRNYKRVADAWLQRVAEEEEEESSKDSGKGVSGLFVRFLKEQGNKIKKKSPDSGNEVELVSLQSSDNPKAKKIVKDEFEKWKKSLDEKGDEGSSEKAEKSEKSEKAEESQKPQPKPQPKKSPAHEKMESHLNKLTKEVGGELAGLLEITNSDPSLIFADLHGMPLGLDSAEEVSKKALTLLGVGPDGASQDVDFVALYESLSEMVSIGEDHTSHHLDENGERRPNEMLQRIESLRQAVEVASIAHGQEPASGTSITPAQSRMIQNMAQTAAGKEVLSQPANTWHHKDNHQALVSGYKSMSHEDRLEALGGSDSIAGQIAEAATRTDNPELQTLITEIAINFHLDTALIEPVLKKESEEKPSRTQPSRKTDREPVSVETEATSDGPSQSCSDFDCDALIERIEAAHASGGADAAKDVVNEVRCERMAEMLEYYTEEGTHPGPMGAGVGAFCESRDSRDLHMKTDPPTKSPL